MISKCEKWNRGIEEADCTECFARGGSGYATLSTCIARNMIRVKKEEPDKAQPGPEGPKL